MNSSVIHRRTWFLCLAGLCLSLVSISSQHAHAFADPQKSPSVLDIGSRRELFVDDWLIDQFAGEARLQLHHPTPRDIAIVHDQPWEGSGSGYHTVFQDGDIYRLYYRGLHLAVSKTGLSSGSHPPYYCYAESRDGIHWTRPELDIVEFDGSKKNNIILEGRGTHNFAPFKDANPDCPDDARYKALGGVKSEGGLFAFKSADGVHWSPMSDKPVITNGAFDSQNLAFWDAHLGRYRAYWRTFTAGVTTVKEWKPSGYRAIRTGSSSDFATWNDEADLTYADSPPEHLYTNQVGPYARAPHILIGFPTRYIDRGWSASMRGLPDTANREMRATANKRYGTALTEGLLMASHDGVHFKRWNSAFLRPGIQRPGTWQYGHQYIAHHAVETIGSLPDAPNELSVYATEGYWHGKGATLRRYSLRLDGFVSVQAPMKGGDVTTKPVTFSGSYLSLNFATSAAGSVRVEIQDADGKPIPGFELAACPEHFGDTVDRTVTWKTGTDVSKLQGKTVRLRFELKDADLYSLQFVAAE